MKHDVYLRKAIGYCGGRQKDLAKRIKVKPGKISYMLNYARKIKMEDAVKIELAVNGKIQWHHFMESEYQKVRRDWEEKIIDRIGKYQSEIVPLSEKIYQAMEYEKQQGNRRGQRSDLQLRKNSCEVMGRTDKSVAKLFRIGSAWTYRQAKKVVTLGVPELIERMNQKKLKIWVLAILANCPPEEQREKLTQSDEEIIAYAKQIKSTPKNQSL
jgi:DNA-binding transcriptional regulator YdaS (Cro superfamily)